MGSIVFKRENIAIHAYVVIFYRRGFVSKPNQRWDLETKPLQFFLQIILYCQSVKLIVKQIKMKRRKFIRYLQASLLAVIGTGLTSKFHNSQAQTGESLTITWLGHTCFLFEGGDTKVLVNPFRQIGCTAGYRDPK